MGVRQNRLMIIWHVTVERRANPDPAAPADLADGVRYLVRLSAQCHSHFGPSIEIGAQASPSACCLEEILSHMTEFEARVFETQRIRGRRKRSRRIMEGGKGVGIWYLDLIGRDLRGEMAV